MVGSVPITKRQINELAILALAETPHTPETIHAVTYKEANRWALRNHRTDLPESQFYAVRNAIEIGIRQRVSTVPAPVVQDAPVSVPAPVVQEDGIVELVVRLKEITTKLGRERTKQLVDVL